MMDYFFNEFQTPIEDLHLERYDPEILEQFFDFLTTVPYIRNLVSVDRPRAKDLPRDSKGRIIVDVTKPHILEDMDYFREAAKNFEENGAYTNLRPNPNPNSAYGKWIREEVRRCFEGMVRPSDGEWITGDYYFFLNYCPMSLVVTDEEGLDNRILGFPRVWEGHYLLTHYLHLARINKKHAFQLASRARGKAHPYSLDVFTPEGWKKWGDIKIGDYLYGDDGLPTKVIDIPYDEESVIYEITLIDGRKIRCTEGHLFKVKDHSKKKERIVECTELLKNYIVPRHSKKAFREFNYRIPVAKEIDFAPTNTEVDPYTLGVLLGDGCFRTNKVHHVDFTSHINDIDTYISNIPYDIHKIPSSKYTYSIKLDTKLLGDLWMKKSTDKYIPQNYLYNSKDVRLSVLQGLMDTDGTVAYGTPIFSTTSEKLKNDVVFLVRSLGYNCSISEKIPKYKEKECHKCWNIRIFAGKEVFRLKRKQDKVYNTNTSRYKYTAIVDIKQVGVERAKCVTVDNNSNCYLVGDFVVTHNSFIGAALLAKRFILGESKTVYQKVISYITASDKKYLVGGDLTLDKFVFDIDHCTNNTEFPRGRIINAINDLQWVAGYKDTETGTNKGSLNSVIGVSSSKDEGKLRGTRGVLYILEEAGTFSRLLNTYGNLRHSVEQGKKVYGTIFGYGTAGDSESDFSAMQQIMYNPKGFNVNEVDNVYDKEGYGRNTFVYFFPAYMNYEGYYNKDGVSDVTGSLLEILKDRYEVKYNSTDISAITKRIAEAPIVPQEAILRTRGNIFPTTQLTERVAQLDGDPKAFDDVYVGDLVLGNNGVVKFVSNNKTPIRDFPLKEDTPTEGAIEIFELPLEKEGRVMPNRYIIGFDPYDNDLAASKSLGSIFVLDLFTDRIVAEYTGRPMFADELYEKCRLLCMFYNAKCLYESNKKGTFAYFQKMNSTHLLADTPEYLRDKQLIKYSSFGSNVKGVNASAAINNYANGLLRDWLLKPVTTVTRDAEGKEIENTLANLYFVRNRALLRECIVYNPLINVDRIRSMGMVMLYREEKMILYNGEITENKVSGPKQTLALDPFFTRNYQNPITTSLFYLLF